MKSFTWFSGRCYCEVTVESRDDGVLIAHEKRSGFLFDSDRHACDVWEFDLLRGLAGRGGVVLLIRESPVHYVEVES